MERGAEMNGYMGGILKVNLSTGAIDNNSFTEDFARMFLGGNGFAVKLIYDHVPASADPLSDENAVVLATGPLNESPVWGTGRGHLAAISPLTGYFADSNFGGDAASRLKRAGADAVFITGKAQTPVYLLIENGTAQIKEAHSLWGKTTGETHAILAEREGAWIETAVIGPAGENGVLFANVMCSGSRVSAAGRCGIGAVLGAKNLKALVFKGDRKIEVSDEARLKALLASRLSTLKENTQILNTIGTPFLINMLNTRGMLATHNNTRETFAYAHDISGELIAEKYKQKNIACHRCPVACGKLVHVPEGEFVGRDVKMAEFETIYAFGSMLDNRDIVSIFNANAMCDQMGIDTISMGVTIAFLTECMEKGVVSAKELGYHLEFGIVNLTELVRLTAFRQGIGELLSLGSERISRRLRKNADRFLYAVKGLDIAGHSARAGRSMGLAYATSTRGGSHHDARPKYPDVDEGFASQPEYCIASQNYTAIGDSLVLCRFVMERGFGIRIDEPLKDALKYVTGWDLSLEEFGRIGERIYNLERLINVQRGVERTQDTLPWRVMHEPIPDGPAQGRYCPPEEFEKMLNRYYTLRGWDRNGVPTKHKLSELDIS